MKMEVFKSKKFDLKTEHGTIIRGAIFTEKPSFNYTEYIKTKNKIEEIKKLKILKENLCKEMRINKQDISIDEKRYKLWTSRRIVVRHKQEIKSKNLAKDNKNLCIKFRIKVKEHFSIKYEPSERDEYTKEMLAELGYIR